LKRNGFPASPADRRRPRGRKIGRPSDSRKSGRCIGGLDAPVRSASPASLPLRHVASGVAARGALGPPPWGRPWPDPARPGCREGRDLGGRSPECSRTHVRQESPSGLGPLHRRFIGRDVASARRRMIASGCERCPYSVAKCRILYEISRGCPQA
jgi:hypothetical protein